MNNCENTLIYLLRSQKIKITETTIKEKIKRHPHYPSLFSISDFLNEYNIKNIALHTTFENANDVSL